MSTLPWKPKMYFALSPQSRAKETLWCLTIIGITYTANRYILVHTPSNHHKKSLTYHFMAQLLFSISTLFKNYLKCRIWILAFSTNFWPIKTDISGNTVWHQALCFQKLAKMDHFWHFQLTFVHSKCKRRCWMILFLWFSNTYAKNRNM